jgi:16S rRNA (adenine(1408)-N(1))-methyltransferase
MPNLAYLRAAVEELPLGLAGVADQVTVVLPWGSLLAAVALPEPALLGRLRAVCQPGATLTLVLGTDAARDAGELGRLGLTGLAPRSLASRLGDGYAAAGFEIAHVRLLPPRELAGWPSSWARRLAHASGRSFAQVDARAL